MTGIFTSNKKKKVNNTDIPHLFDTESGFTPTIESFKVCIMYTSINYEPNAYYTLVA